MVISSMFLEYLESAVCNFNPAGPHGDPPPTAAGGARVWGLGIDYRYVQDTGKFALLPVSDLGGEMFQGVGGAHRAAPTGLPMACFLVPAVPFRVDQRLMQALPGGRGPAGEVAVKGDHGVVDDPRRGVEVVVVRQVVLVRGPRPEGRAEPRRQEDHVDRAGVERTGAAQQ